MTIIYLTLEQAIAVHAKTIDASGGGTHGQMYTGTLDSVLDHIQNDDYYPTLEAKLTHLFFGACKFHCFEDGNKRIAITLCAQMLLFNGHLHCVERFIRDMENISYHVASGAISKDLLSEIMTAFISGDDEDESLKLKIFQAIAGQESCRAR